jgi:hypothetical protein
VLLENELALCSADADPVTHGHSLVIPRRHGSDGLALHQPEWNAVVELLKLRREELGAQDASISGWAGLLNARGGAELRRGGGADGVSCTLASDPTPGGGLRAASGWSAGVIPSRRTY